MTKLVNEKKLYKMTNYDTFYEIWNTMQRNILKKFQNNLETKMLN